MLRPLRLAASIAVASLALASPALADSAGTDPSANYPAGALPDACSAPASTDCINASVAILNQARASLGQPAYALPSNFTTLTGPEQGFVLANLDRVLYGLAPITGLSASLNNDAAGGVQQDADPQPSAQNYLAWTANWAGGFDNMPLAYEAWMYDDGPGSGNLDCSSSNTSGCWGHRHDVLYRFDNSGPLAMGVAQGTDPGGQAGYAMLLFEGDSTYHPSYVYTWAQAVAAGAGTGAGGGTGPSAPISPPNHSHTPKPTGPGTTSVPARVTIAINLHGNRVSVTATLPRGSHLQCAFTPRAKHGWARDHYRACRAVFALAAPRPGRYRLRVRAAGVVSTRYLRVS